MYFQDLLPVEAPVPDPQVPTMPASVLSLMSVFTLPTEEPELSVQEVNTLTYIAGYILKKVKNRLSLCTECEKKISSDGVDVYDDNYDFVKAKNFSGAKKGLEIPSPILVDVVKASEVEYVKVIDNVMHKQGVKASIISALLKVCNVKDLLCDQCNVHLAIVQLMVNIRFHHTIRQANIKLRDQKDRTNRKVMKFSHL